MKTLLSIVLFFLVAAVFRNLSAQSSAESAENTFFKAIRANQNESYITFAQGLGNLEPLIFEASIEPYFLIRTSKDARWGVTLSPTIRLRMFAEESLPVRTPSYNPYVSIYRQIQLKQEEITHTLYVFLTLAHHSNGQEGDFYAPDGTINTRTGNFSTNYFEVGLFFNRHLLPFSNTNEYIKTSLEIHPGLDMNPELEGQYGKVRWHNRLKIYRFSWKQIRSFFDEDQDNAAKIPVWSATFQTIWIFGEASGASPADFGERLNFMAKLAFRPINVRDVSFFVKLYTGKDYYNICFTRRISTLQIGLQAFAF